MAVKLHPTTTTLSAAIEDAYGILAELRDEVQEVYDNMPDSLQSGDRASTLEETASTLSEFCDDVVEIPEQFRDKPVTYGSNRRKSQSRADRRDEACRMLGSASDVLDDVVSFIQESIVDDDVSEVDKEEMEEWIQALEEAREKINQDASNADDVEFPGMMG